MSRQFQIGGIFWMDNANSIEYQTSFAYVNEVTEASPAGGFRSRIAGGFVVA